MSIIIDEEFKALIPPLSEDEFKQLEENCVKDGIRDPLVVWELPNGDLRLIDGHNRFQIATKHGLPWTEKRMRFDLREDVKRWIILNQFGRRNLSAYDRSLLALKLKPMIQEEAKKKEHERKTTCQKSDKSYDTKKDLATIAGVSHDTIHRVEVIEEKATPEEKQKLRSGELSINQVYTNHVISKKVDPVKQAAKEHEDFKQAQKDSVVDFNAAAIDRDNRKILSLDFYSRCMRLGSDIFEIYDKLRTEYDIEELKKNLTEEQTKAILSHLNDVVRQTTAISVKVTKNEKEKHIRLY